MKEIKLYREDNGQYSTSEAQQDDVSGSYVQKTDYDELKRENEELRASLMKIKGSILSLSCNKENNSGHEPSLSVYQRSIDEVISEGLSLQAQHLADIKADAVIEAANTLCITGSSVKTVRYDKYIEYADKLREGK